MDVFGSHFWVYNFLFLFAIHGSNKTMIDYFFFLDKSKSFRRKYRKGHNFLYKCFMCYVFNKEYLQASKYRRYIITYYIHYAFLKICGYVLEIISTNTIVKIDPDSTTLWIVVIIYIAVGLLSFVWFAIHHKGKGVKWLLWEKGEFKMDKRND